MEKEKSTFFSGLKRSLSEIGISRIIVGLFFVFLLFMTSRQELPGTITNILTRIGMHGILVLSMVPSIRSGLGPNFAVPFGIIGGLLGGLISVQFNLTGLTGFVVALLCALVISFPMGLLFGFLMNRVMNSEMMVATYFGYAVVAIMCIGWLVLPFTNNAITWTMGAGLRNTINLQPYFGDALNRIGMIKRSYAAGDEMMIPVGWFLVWAVVMLVAYFKYLKIADAQADAPESAAGTQEQVQKTAARRRTGLILMAAASVIFILLSTVNLGFVRAVRGLLSIHIHFTAATSMEIPTGMLVFLLLCCFLMWLFNQSKTGIAMAAVGSNPVCARAGGANIRRQRMIGAVMSTMLAAVGIVVYAQSFGFLQLYNAPLTMCFPPIAAILIGGASVKKAKISHVLIGVTLFQGILTMGPTIAARYLAGLSEGTDPTEIVRIIITNGIILYALTKAGGASNEE